MTTLDLKRGDTLCLDCKILRAGAALDISGWLIDCWLRRPDGNTVHRFAPMVLDAAGGHYRLLAPAAQTVRWPIGVLSMDIRYTDAGGYVTSTRTVSLRIADSISTP